MRGEEDRAGLGMQPGACTTYRRDGGPPRQAVKNSEMPLAECAGYRGGGAAVLIGTEDLVAALDQGFHGFITGARGSQTPTT